MADAIILQGKFTSTGTAKTITLRSDLDWMKVYNYTNATGAGDDGCQFYWQRGMADGTGLVWFKNGGGDDISLLNISNGGFTLVSSEDAEFAAPVAITSSTDATQPVFTVADTGALSTGDSVRITGMAGQTNLNGYEFEITVINGTTFKPSYALATAPGVAGTGGYYSQRLREPIFNPQNRLICNVSQAANAVVTFTRAHSYEVDDYVRFNFFGSAWGDFVDISEVQAKVVAVATSTITVDYSTTSLPAFAFPLPARYPFTPAAVVPFGGNTEAVGTNNVGYIGMKLGAGALTPGGQNNDVMYWVAGKSFSVDNQ